MSAFVKMASVVSNIISVISDSTVSLINVLFSWCLPIFLYSPFGVTPRIVKCESSVSPVFKRGASVSRGCLGCILHSGLYHDWLGLRSG